MIFDFRFSGTSPFTIRWQFLRQWLFYQHRVHQPVWDCFLFGGKEYASVLRISSSRPITGSSLPCLASSFRFFAYLFSALNSCDCVCEVTVFAFSQFFDGSDQSFFGKTCIFQQFCCSIISLHNGQQQMFGCYKFIFELFQCSPARNTTLFASRLI